MDRQLQQYWLSQYLKLPANQRIAALDQWLGGRDAAAVQAAVGKLDGTALGSTQARLTWLTADRAAFEASTDPAIQYAVAVT
ncbi:S46 family peptidase, partial [Xanthomonas euvesicatoria]